MKRILCTLALLVMGITSAAAENKPARKPTPLEAMYAKYRVVASKYSQVRQTVTSTAELQRLRKAWMDAEAKVQSKVESLSVKERQAEQAARDALNAAIDKQIAADQGIAKLNKQRQSLQKQIRDARFQIAQLSLQLHHSDSPVNQALDADTKLAALKKAAWKGDRKERIAAYKKYTAARSAKLKTLKLAKPLLAKTESLNKEIVDATKASYKALREIGDIERKIRFSKDKSLQPLRDKLAAANKATRKVYSHPATKDLRAAAYKAGNAYREKYRKVTSASKELAALQQQINDINKDIRALRAKTKKPAKKGK